MCDMDLVVAIGFIIIIIFCFLFLSIWLVLVAYIPNSFKAIFRSRWIPETEMHIFVCKKMNVFEFCVKNGAI